MKKVLYMSFLVFSAILLGSVVGKAVEDNEFADWLNRTLSFDFQPGEFFRTEVLRITFGLSLNINVAQVLFIAAVLFIYYKTAPKLIK